MKEWHYGLKDRKDLHNCRCVIVRRPASTDAWVGL
jgi:hypothetical protein